MSRPLAAGLLLSLAWLSLPGGAGSQEVTGHRVYGILAYEPGSGQLGLAAASTGFSVASGGALVESGTGAVLVHPAFSGEEARSALRSLREGVSPSQAVSGRAGRGGVVQIGALTPGCTGAAREAADAPPGTSAESGEVGGICFLALGTRLLAPGQLSDLVEGFTGASGTLTERLVAALEAVEESWPGAGGSRSAVVWVASEGEEGPLGRSELRLQVDDHGRPVRALRETATTGRADWLARRAGRAVDAGRFEEAASVADSAAALDLSNPVAWLHLGRARLYQEREEEAEEAFRRMLELDPWMLGLLGNPRGPSVREGVIPFYPRLLRRLDVYRREFFDDIDFGERGY